MRQYLTAMLAAAAALICLALPAASADDYEFSFDYGKYSFSLPTAQAPEVKYYTDMPGGEYTWLIDNGGELALVYGMSRPIDYGDYYYTFEGCKDIERFETETIKVGETRWKASAADVTFNKDDTEATYVDVWCTRRAWQHDIRFVYVRVDDKEALMKDVRDRLKGLEWWN